MSEAEILDATASQSRRLAHEKKQNDQVLASGLFLKACELAKIEPTRRQAGKWNRHQGKAREFQAAAKAELKKAEQESGKRPAKV